MCHDPKLRENYFTPDWGFLCLIFPTAHAYVKDNTTAVSAKPSFWIVGFTHVCSVGGCFFFGLGFSV